MVRLYPMFTLSGHTDTKTRLSMAGNFLANVRQKKAAAAQVPAVATRPHRKPKAQRYDVAGGGHYPESGADFLVYVRLKKIARLPFGKASPEQCTW